MTERKAELIAAAVEAINKAYAPYSNHPVGSAILGNDGEIYSGCNVENASFSLGQCAESTAIGNMVLSGGSAIEHVVVVGPGEHLCTPCGACRQRIREFSGETGTPITVCDQEGNVLLETDIAELLPYSFGPENVEKTRS